MQQMSVTQHHPAPVLGGITDNRHQGLVMGTPVMTAEGEMPVEYLVAGDRIVTRAGMRVLQSVIATRADNLAVLRISQGVLDNDTPSKDIFVLPQQPILLHGWRAKLFYGRETVMKPAADLLDGEFIRAEILPQTGLFQLRFAGDEVIYSAGMEISCATPNTATV